MLPILYPANTQKSGFFANNGLGFIKNCKRCEVTEERNGAFLLEMDVLITDRLAEQITPMAVIKCIPNAFDSAQLFEIYFVTKNDKTISVKAQHIRYRLSANIFTDIYAPNQNKTPAQTWGSVQTYLYYDNEFTFTSDIVTAGIPTAAANEPIRMGDFLLGEEGSMIDTFGGEYAFDNYTVSLLTARGSDTGICLRCGSGVASFEYEADASSIYSDILPYAKVQYKKTTGENVGSLYISLDPISTGNTVLQSPRGLTYDFSQNFYDEYPDFFIETVSGANPVQASYDTALSYLRTLANKYINQNSETLKNLSVTLTIDTQPEIDQVQACKLCDTIAVYYEPLNFTATAKVFKIVFDVLQEKNITVELGNAKKNLSKFFSNINIGDV